MKITTKVTTIDKQNIARAYLERNTPVKELAEKFGVTRQYIYMVLRDYDANYRSIKEARDAYIKELVTDDPNITVAEVLHNLDKAGHALPTSATISTLIMTFAPETRDTYIVQSKAKRESLRKGRVRLTEKFLREEYINQDKTQVMIGEESGYTQGTIGKYLKKHDISKAQEHISQNMAEKRRETYRRLDRQMELRNGDSD